MKFQPLACTGAIALFVVCFTVAAEKESRDVPAALNFKMKGIDGKEIDLAQHKGKVVLLVNVASYCGYTSQYKGLQALHDRFAKDGLVIIGVPANEFGAQEPGSDSDIAEFCNSKYGVKFTLLSKVVVKGKGICPLYQHLTDKVTNPKHGGEIAWNFEKFLIGKNGEIVGRFKSSVKPEGDELTRAIETELKK
jgi:glutathione peroxidase